MRALIILADEFEDIEAFTTIDILDRAKIDVTKVGLGSKVITSSHGVRVMADKILNEIDPDAFDMLVLPGGPGYKNLLNSGAVIKLVKSFNNQKKTIGAICAAPLVLAAAGVLDDKVAVVYPGMEKSIPKVRDAKVIASGNIITSRSAGTAIEFALMLVERTLGKKEASKVREKLVI